MTRKTLIKHVFASLLFCILWQFVCWNADEFNGGVIFEKCYDVVKSLPLVSEPENPISFAMAFFIYPILIYWSVVGVWYVITKRKTNNS